MGFVGRRHRKWQNRNCNKQKQALKKQETPLKGTLASMFLLGFLIIFSWITVYFLFLHRL
ncbi:hypothetical protein [Saccharococcus caldoxylosilyticus]|uniref:hypothetical protein n=1 Tax=Saccharococcus caldoxylosilyticus TaxID=81408 RepID=UPI0008FBA150